MTILNTVLRHIFSRENMFALVIVVVAVFLIIVTADSAPQWIYQGF